MQSKEDIKRVIDLHGDTVWRVCVLYFGQSADAQDAFQETLLKYSLADTAFADEEHRKAWLIRVAANAAKDMLKSAYRKDLPLSEEVQGKAAVSSPEDMPGSKLREALDAIRSLDDPLRTSVYLALYEGYTAPEISAMLDAPVNTVYSWIARGKQQLKEVLR